jgi:GDP-L-fucose synthase
MYKDKNVLIVGGAGFVGVNLILKLLTRGARIRATLHEKGAVIKGDSIEYIKCDLTKKKDCQKVVQGMDYVFMCAANTSGAAVMEKTPLVHVTPNVIMNTLLLEAAYEAKIKKFLWFSSNTVYPVVDYPVKEDEGREGKLFEKYFCVAWMKRFTEILCQMYSEKIKTPMKVVVIRPANIYGPYDDFEWATSHVLPALMRKVIERHDPIEIWGNGEDIKDLIFIDDFIEGTLLAMEKIDTYDPINIGTGVACSIKEAFGHMLEVDGYKDAKVVFDASKPTMIPKRLIDVSKAKEILGFQARTSIREGLDRTMKWYREFNKV